ncbi:hypothetical protein H105_01064 [Trichophyton soudanense CBS 452.61]|uniref:Uncharacterized protein n=1 Tax=Trichophyton soudanense CBS 452.61 TaxID=1215331 RepID=A0A022Y5A3_TRISD|nr:hypothetical protein H105_01064 [Trichophyton soudanense CBS 452.61]
MFQMCLSTPEAIYLAFTMVQGVIPRRRMFYLSIFLSSSCLFAFGLIPTQGLDKKRTHPVHALRPAEFWPPRNMYGWNGGRVATAIAHGTSCQRRFHQTCRGYPCDVGVERLKAAEVMQSSCPIPTRPTHMVTEI